MPAGAKCSACSSAPAHYQLKEALAAIRAHDVFRKPAVTMLLYLLVAGYGLATVALAQAGASPVQPIQSLERRIDRIDRDLERLDAAQRLTRLETYMQAAKENSESNRQMFLVILCGILLILVAVIVLLIGRTQPRASGPPPAQAVEFHAAVAVVLQHEGTYLDDPRTGEISKFGITAEFLRSVGRPHDRDAVRNLTEQQAIELYRVHWWDKYA